jgi:hypothetical protein
LLVACMSSPWRHSITVPCLLESLHLAEPSLWCSSSNRTGMAIISFSSCWPCWTRQVLHPAVC